MSLNIRNLAARLFQRFTKPNTLKATPNRARLSVTALEDRTVPTAVIDVSVLAHATEGGYGALQFTRSVDTTGAITVNYSIGGTATNGSDHSLGTSGTATFADGIDTATVSFIPTNDSVGEPTETIVFTLTSGTGYTIGTAGVATVNLFDNDTPTATDDEFGGDEDDDVTGNVLTNDTDPNSDTLTATLVDDAWFGAVSLSSNGAFTYTPDDNFFGTDEFTYSISDGTGGTATATVTITIDPVDDDPVIENQSFSIHENMPEGIPIWFVAASDPDPGQSLTYSITAGNGAGVFGIDADTGEITIIDSDGLDYEAVTSFALTIQVEDNGTTPLNAAATVTISVDNLAEDAEETEGERIEFLNDDYDDIRAILDSDSFDVEPNLANEFNPASDVIDDLQTMIDCATAMNAAVIANNGATYNFYRDGYELAMMDLGVDRVGVYALSLKTIDKAFEMAAFSEGDKFRLEGIGALMSELRFDLDQIEAKIDEAATATMIVDTTVFGLGFSDPAFGAAFSNFGQAMIDLTVLTTLSGTYATYSLNAAFLNGAPAVIDDETIDDLNVIAENLLDPLAYLDPENEGGGLSLALTVAQGMFEQGVVMLATYSNSAYWQNLYYPALGDYLGDEYEGIGRYALTGDVNPADAAYPEDVDPEDDLFENYGLVGWIFAATQAIQLQAEAAVTIADDVGLALEIDDKLRYKGIDSYLAKLEGRLNRLRFVIEGNEEGETQVEQVGLAEQMSDLIAALEGDDLEILLPQRYKLLTLYAFVLDGGNGFDGVNDHISNAADLRADLPSL